MSKNYPIERSPLYRLRNRRKLAELLGLPKNYFKKEHSYKYKEFSRAKLNGNGNRNFTEPLGELKKIQKNIYRLLSRIETPIWIISGKKGKSYISNCREHVNNGFVKTMDISKFYDSAKKKYIYMMFKEKFYMDKDIARIMTSLVTYKNALPTGSPSSQLIVFWAYKDMFIDINKIAEHRKCKFTLYVDDMTFSSDTPIDSELRKEVERILNKYGLHSKLKKDHYYQVNDFKVITGVGIKNSKVVLPNVKRKAILDQYEKCKEKNNLHEIEKLRGMLCSARQIEPGIFHLIDSYVNKYQRDLASLSRTRLNKKQKVRLKI